MSLEERAKERVLREELLKRALLPELLFVDDLARVLSISPSAVCKMIRRGACGPYAIVGHRFAVRRESLLEAIRAREITPEAQARPSPATRAAAQLVGLLRGRRAGPSRRDR